MKNEQKLNANRPVGEIASGFVFCYRFAQRGITMENFYEIMDFCGFDMTKASDMAKEYAPIPWINEAVEEAMTEVGLETLSAKSIEN